MTLKNKITEQLSAYLNKNHLHKPVEIHLVNLGVKRLNVLVSLVEKNGEIGKRGFHWEHLGEGHYFTADLVQHSFYS